MNTHRLLIVTFLALLLTPLAALAQTWDGGGADNNFTTPANWNPNALPVNNGTADLLFGGSVRLTPKVNVDYDVDSVTFNNTSGAFNIGQLNNSKLFLRGGGITNLDTTTQTFSVPVGISSAVTFTGFFADNGNLTFTEPVGLGTKSLAIGGDFQTNITAIDGTGSIVKLGAGVLRIESGGTDQYDLTVNAGSVYCPSDKTFGSSATIAINGGTAIMTGDFTLDGAQLTVASIGTFVLDQDDLFDTVAMTVQSGGDATILSAYVPQHERIRVTGAGSTFTFGDFDIASDSQLAVLAGAEVEITGAFKVGVNGFTSSVLVDGPNSTFRLSNAAVLEPQIGGGQGHGGSMTFRNRATGDLGNDTLLVSAGFYTDGTLAVESGAQVTVGALRVGHMPSSLQSSTVTISGPGSRLTATSNVVPFEIGNANDSSGIVNVENGGELDLNGPLVIHEAGALNINGGILSMKLDETIANGGTLNFNTGRLNLGENFGVGGGPSLLGVNVNLGTGRAVSVPSTRSTTIASPGSLVLDGGSLSTGSLVNNGGTIDFRRGALSITGFGGLTIDPGGPLGAAVSLSSGQILNVTNEATVQNGASLLIETGGTFNAGTLTSNGSVVLDGANSTLAGGVMNNAGVLRGDGRVTARVSNLATGEIRAELGKALRFNGAAGPNNGRITLQGGTLQFTQAVTNAATGVMSGRGTLFFDGGLTNQGKMQLSGGPTDIYGNVSFTGGGEMINSGGANVVTFYGNVTHNGDEIRTSPTNTTVFFGNVTGAGPFTGTGDVRFEGAFMPGASPAAVSIEGDMQLGTDANLVMELGGTVAGAQYDQLHVGALLSLDGTLAVSLLDGFAPRYGDTFDLFNFGTLAGRFDTINLPALDGGLGWDTTSLYTTGTIIAVPEPRSYVLLASAISCLCIVAWRAAIRKLPKVGGNRKRLPDGRARMRPAMP